MAPNWLPGTTAYTYDTADRLTSTARPNGLTSDRTYDNADRLLTVLNRNGGTPISSFTYALDNVGNRTQVVDTNGTTTYGYDGLYRLTAAAYPNGDTQAYTYDAMGNRLTMVNNGVTGTYAYNGDGLRTTRTIGGAGVSYVWDQNAGLPVILQDSAGNRYVYGLDLISRTDSLGNQEYELSDGLGSTTGLADGTGAVTDTYAYDVYGAVRARTGTSPNEFTFTGEQVDATGLQYLRARYYDAATGRFVSGDPLPLLQRYAYVGNNPATFVDPSGLCGVRHPLRCAQNVSSAIDSSVKNVGNAEAAILSQVIDPADPQSIAKFAETVSGVVLEGCAIGTVFGATEAAAPIAVPVCTGAAVTFAGSVLYQEATANSAHQRVFIGAGAVGSLLIPGKGGEIFSDVLDALADPGVAEASNELHRKE